MTEQEKLVDYFNQLRKPFVKLCRLRFLQPDGSTAFALDNNPLNRRSGAFLAEGNLTVNLQNGARRQASVTLGNLDGAYDYNVNKVWFGQQVALDEGLILSDRTDYYIQQGVFYIKDPVESITPTGRTATYNLVDKWAYLDGSLFGNLEGTYEVAVNTNVFTPIAALLQLTRGNGYPIDSATPIFTNYYNNKTQQLPDGSTVSLAVTPYTLRIDSDSGTYADVVLGLCTMLNAWVGYDPSGALRIDPSQDDIADIDKPVLWQFSMSEAELLGPSYAIKNGEVYNDIIVTGQALEGHTQPVGRAENYDLSSDTNVYSSLGRRTKRMAAAGYYTLKQCQDRAAWELKRATVLSKAVTISCGQMFHLQENNLVTIARTDKTGSPVERHLIQGFSRPLSGVGAMTINAISVNDYPQATITKWPE